MSDDSGANGEGIQGVLVDKVEGVSQLPDGNVALIIRNGDMPIGIIFKPDDARDAAELLDSVWDTSAVEGDAAN
ncbi:hypothetical protein [Consotaella salsifontis]|uniref:Uncharacterized protein n=1 Tax=Consotaella salsifontis TaxID=1365950 RepID=A0A1T4R5P5_9HYPH|nr:hypothetical protein [Consotaella salsifontis]SKA11217.1 hypothetical protein SAMN05428963_10639 [Consotaella salsifontis]